MEVLAGVRLLLRQAILEMSGFDTVSFFYDILPEYSPERDSSRVRTRIASARVCRISHGIR